MQKTLTDIQPAVPLYYVKYGLNYVVSNLIYRVPTSPVQFLFSALISSFITNSCHTNLALNIVLAA